jgi:hypothetical protein
MTRNVNVDDFYENPAKSIDEVGDDPLHIGGFNGDGRVFVEILYRRVNERHVRPGGCRTRGRTRCGRR